MEQKDIHKLQCLNTVGYLKTDFNPNLSNYVKTNIAEKTNAHTDMRNAKSTGRVRDDVPVRSITL